MSTVKLTLSTISDAAHRKTAFEGFMSPGAVQESAFYLGLLVARVLNNHPFGAAGAPTGLSEEQKAAFLAAFLPELGLADPAHLGKTLMDVARELGKGLPPRISHFLISRGVTCTPKTAPAETSP